MHLRFYNHLCSWVKNKDLTLTGHLSVCKHLWCFWGDPTLFDGDYLCHLKHCAAKSDSELDIGLGNLNPVCDRPSHYVIISFSEVLSNVPQ